MSISLITQPSAELRYTESKAFIKAPAIPNYADTMLGKEGFVQYKHNDQRWYFRDATTAEWRWVHFHQIAFVPMPEDKILVTSQQIPYEYRYDRYQNLSDNDIRDLVVTVTKVEWYQPENGDTGCARITGEVKSRQKPDDTEQIQFDVPRSGLSTPWVFAAMALTPEDSEDRATRFHEFHRLSVNLYDFQRLKNDYYKDIELLGQMLLEEAETRQWCEEYDTFIDRFNEKSKVATIEPRSNDYEVEVTYEITIRVTNSVITAARNEDEAMDNVREMGIGDMDFDLHNHLSNFDYDVVDEEIYAVGDATEC